MNGPCFVLRCDYGENITLSLPFEVLWTRMMRYWDEFLRMWRGTRDEWLNASSQASDLRRHLKTHSGEKKNECNQCDYASSYASTLRTHLKTHSGEKSNKCNQCDFASSRAGNLRTHLKTHSGEKSYKCKHCDYACSDPSSFRSHLKRHRPV